MGKSKKIMVIDDLEIDRTILNAILSSEFEVIEKCGGYTAIEYLVENVGEVDAILLDISMPGMTGFDVLDFMKESEMDFIPVLLITAEATRENVEKAKQYGIAGFIRKPFDREDVMQRLRLNLGVFPEFELTPEAVKATKKHIDDLKMVYKRYLINFSDDMEHYARLPGLMRILLNGYNSKEDTRTLTKEQIEIICQASFFCDIGNMIVPPRSVRLLKNREGEKDIYQNHTVAGAEIINLNRTEECRFFVNICADICMHHHERYDGKGFPNRIIGEHNLVYTQIFRMAEKFDKLFTVYVERNSKQFEYAVTDFTKDKGNVSEEVSDLLEENKEKILEYYKPAEE